MDHARHYPGTITKAWYGREDHGVLTCVVGVDFPSHFYQGFGCLALDDETGPAFVRALCAAFGVADLGALVGEACVGYWWFGEHNEPVDALCSTRTGRTFSIQAWREKIHPGTPSPVEQKRRDLRDRVACVRRQLDDNLRQLDDNLRQLEEFERRYGGGHG